MAYKKETENLLAGSVNILPPVDLLPAQDALRLLNLRANTEGSLRSRFGDVGLNSSTTGAVTSACRVEPSTVGARTTPTRYFGAGGSLYRNGTIVLSGFGTNVPISMCSFQGYLWATTDQLRCKDDGSSVFEWQVAAPPATFTATAVTSSGATMVGTYEYFLSFVMADGSESSVSSGVSVTVAAGQGVTLSSFPAYAPPTGFSGQVTDYNVYRGGGTQTSTVLVATFPVSSGSYTDTIDDIDAQEDDAVLLATDYDQPAAAYSVAPGPFYDRLLMFCSAAHPNRLWFSISLQPYAWPGATAANLTSNNWVDVGDLGEAIYLVTIRPNSITIYKQKSIWRIYGDPGGSSAILECVSRTYGILGRQAGIGLGTMDFFLNTEGVFAWSGEAGTKMSQKLNPIFYGEYPDVPLNLVVPMDIGNRALVAFGYRRGQLWVSYPQQGQSGTVANNYSLIFDTQTKNWVNDSRGFAFFFDEGQTGDFLAGQGTELLAVESGIDDSGTPIAVDYVSQFSNQQNPENSKIYNDLTVEINTGGSSFTAYALIDDGMGAGVTLIALGAMQCTVRQSWTFNYGSDRGVRGIRHAIRITGTMELSPGPTSNPLSAILYKATLHYIVQPRFSKTFDSDVTDCQMRDVKFCDFLEFDIDLQGSGAGVYTWTVYSDRPRATSGTVQMKPATATAATAAGGFTIGATYTIVAAGTTNFVSIGAASSTVGVVFVATGVGSGTGTAAATATGTFTDSTILGRRPIRIQLTEFEGQLLRVTLTADLNGLFLVYSVRLRVRPIGVYLDGANGENFQTKEIGIAI